MSGVNDLAQSRPATVEDILGKLAARGIFNVSVLRYYVAPTSLDGFEHLVFLMNILNIGTEHRNAIEALIYLTLYRETSMLPENFPQGIHEVVDHLTEHFKQKDANRAAEIKRAEHAAFAARMETEHGRRFPW